MSTFKTVMHLPLLTLIVVGASLTACSSGDDDLQAFINATNQEAGGRVEPLPEVKPYQTYTYADMNLRSPFMPTSPNAGNPNLRPDAHRNREFLEQYSLDTMKMVGTIQQSGQMYGLVQTKDGLVHRVIVGNYVGQNDGKITAISTSKIDVREIVPDGLGGYIERPAALSLNE
ncbi:MAG TPA: pilus assembly protein PilP [Steroidobacteraceae bacterium]|jgi:type IV pilus assembly protein PilP|nr:pilus assembly protein PilP [Steroidobacteraceae bacterium]